MGAPIVDLVAGIGEAVGNLAVKVREAWTGKAVLDSSDQAKLAGLANDLEKIKSDLSAVQIQAINETMQAEAASKNVMQGSWRPTIGFAFAAIVVNNFVLLPYLVKFGAVYLPVPSEVWYALLAVLGVSAAGRSWEKVNDKD